jgi:broad specificity phosphatase PhoE
LSIHLLRHGEVANPENVVYADLPGFHLSPIGRAQAAITATHLAAAPVVAIVTSPLARAAETAGIVAAPFRMAVTIDERLTEWHLAGRWAGVRWDALATSFPGELEAYLEDPSELPFSPESLHDLAIRITGCLESWSRQLPDGDLVFVSHQDPIHAAARRLTGEDFASFHHSKPAHGSVTTLDRAGSGWARTGYWAPHVASRPAGKS